MVNYLYNKWSYFCLSRSHGIWTFGETGGMSSTYVSCTPFQPDLIKSIKIIIISLTPVLWPRWLDTAWRVLDGASRLSPMLGYLSTLLGRCMLVEIRQTGGPHLDCQMRHLPKLSCAGMWWTITGRMINLHVNSSGLFKMINRRPVQHYSGCGFQHEKVEGINYIWES